MIQLKGELEFIDYWIGALLHDCGKLALGFFFWDHYEELISEMASGECTFREAEKTLCDVANHEFLGRLLLLTSNVGQRLVDAVGTHHSTGSSPDALTCLLHMANNLAKDMGKGYLQEEPTLYSAEVLTELGLSKEGVRKLQNALGERMVEEIEDLVERCMRAN